MLEIPMSMADRDGFIWYDGKLVPWRDATTHVLTHSLHYGLAVFEGVRAYKTDAGTAIFRLKEHTDRLFNSAHIYRMPMPLGQGNPDRGAQGSRPCQPARILLSAADRLLRLGKDGRQPARRGDPCFDRRLALGRLPRRGRPGERASASRPRASRATM
jgi:hypothetical protein